MLIDNYSVSPDRIIGLSHVYYDFDILMEKKGISLFGQLANLGVVSYGMISHSVVSGIPRVPHLVSLGVNVDEFSADIPERLCSVGYASSMSYKTKDGIEIKRGNLAAECAAAAGLEFRPAGSHQAPMSFHDMPAYYRSVDSLLMTSIVEAAGLPVLEAAAAGRLVIGTPVGHFPLRAYQGGGILAPIGAKEFKEFTISTLIYYKDNPQAYIEKCHSIRDSARSYDWRKVINEWTHLIDTAL